jgi:hypothetical protein
VHSGFWWGNLRGRDHLEDPWEVYIKIDLQEDGGGGGGAWNELIWLRIEKGGELL